MDAAAGNAASSSVDLAAAAPQVLVVRGRKHKERGNSLVEVIISMGLLFTILTGFSAAYFKSNDVMKVSVNETVADQAAAAYIEKARAAQWSTVGTDTENTAQLPDPTLVVKGGSLPALSTVTIRGLTITLKTSIGWTKAPIKGATYGSKTLYIDASWQERAGVPGSIRTVRQETTLTPGVDQAVPSGIRGGS
ncbi:hypothetical protein [Pseudarthrobacter sp. BIM B-2242]|uniref:type IV pilus modification PilV family protein n=1 Tax=Pseudarthrobacter sp. BIM B-2242 TaxID=2772401 RepID=UPI00168BF414|nr:hypothetical protein [Pseudarthrobacter sp. BIM B-2242]QOD05727.1 hypothetical protein IDT60_22055 [Pseudarthrobacter sp. BIM B-2242]